VTIPFSIIGIYTDESASKRPLISLKGRESACGCPLKKDPFTRYLTSLSRCNFASIFIIMSALLWFESFQKQLATQDYAAQHTNLDPIVAPIDNFAEPSSVTILQ
jgi:hypothetical protein